MTQHSPSTLDTVRRFAGSIVRLQPREAATALGLSLLTALVEGVGAVLLVPLLAMVGLDVTNGGVGRIAGYVRMVFGHLRVPVALGPVLLVYVTIVSVQALLARRQALSALRLEHAYVAHLRRVLFDGWVHSEWSWQGRWRRADVTHVIVQQVERTGLGVHQLVSASSMSIVSVVYLAIAIRVSPVMTLVVSAAAGVVLLFLRGDVTRAEQEGEALMERSRRLNATLSEHLAATRLAKSVGREQVQIEALTHASDALADAHAGAARVYTGSRVRIEVGGVVALALLLYLSLSWLDLDAGGVALLMYVFARLMPRVAALQQSVQHIAHILPAYQMVDTFRADAETAREPHAGAGTLPDVRGDIELEHVSYVHAGNVVPALDDICVTIPARGLTAVVGPSGAGKSTLADLLCGFLVPAAGRLRSGGFVIDGTARTGWRRAVGYVEQDAFLLHDTIRANLQWAAPQASDAEMREALTRASATFVFELAAGLDTVVGDRGVLLSGGERQRVALARALLNSPRMLVLDEPTSALDPAHEEAILDTLGQLAREMPVVLITHRLAAVRRAARILVLDAGRLVEAGDWGTLRSQSAGRFEALCSAQGVAVP